MTSGCEVEESGRTLLLWGLVLVLFDSSPFLARVLDSRRADCGHLTRHDESPPDVNEVCSRGQIFHQ